jgi:hypothetical protein
LALFGSFEKQVSSINWVCVRAMAALAFAAAFNGPPISAFIGSPENCCAMETKFVSIIVEFNGSIIENQFSFSDIQVALMPFEKETAGLVFGNGIFSAYHCQF